MRSPGASVNLDPPELEDVIAQRETAQRVYDDTRAAFCAWSEEHARTTIRAPRHPRQRPPPPLPQPNPEQKWPRQALFLPDSDSSSKDSAHTVYFDVDEFNPFTGTQHTRVRHRVVRHPRQAIQPVPAVHDVHARVAQRADAPGHHITDHEARTPTTRASTVREYLSKFDNFAWQKDMRDPDCTFFLEHILHPSCSLSEARGHLLTNLRRAKKFSPSKTHKMYFEIILLVLIPL